ncbi:hypothetical protein ACFQVA_01455 [Actinomadura keratinilytica]
MEHGAAYRATLHGASRAGNLVQTFTKESEHSGLSDAEYATTPATTPRRTPPGSAPGPAVWAARHDRR